MNEKERKHQENLQRLQALRPIDDDFMRAMLTDNLPLAQMILRIIVGKQDLVITHCVTQADMKRVTGARSICLDAYGTDSSGKKYDIEIQRDCNGAVPHRARYHSSVMDVENLDAGQDFTELPDTYVIFITEKDFFQDGEAIHVIQNTDRKTGKSFGDGVTILYVNGEYRGDDSLGKLMHDFNCNSAEEMQLPLMAERTKYLKETEKGVEAMCKIVEDMVNEAREESAKEKAIETAKELLLLGKITVDEIASCTKLTVDEVEALRNEMTKTA